MESNSHVIDDVTWPRKVKLMTSIRPQPISQIRIGDRLHSEPPIGNGITKRSRDRWRHVSDPKIWSLDPNTVMLGLSCVLRPNQHSVIYRKQLSNAYFIVQFPRCLSFFAFTARCTLVQDAVLRSHVVCLSACTSVRLPVCDVGELWSHRLEFFENNFTVSFYCDVRSLQPQHDGSAPRGTPLNLGPMWPTHVDLSVGDIRSQILAEWLQIAQRSQWRAYRKLPSLFLMVSSLTPYDLPSPKWGFQDYWSGSVMK